MIAFGTAAATTISLPLAACSDDNTSAPNFSEAGAYGGFFVDAADAHGDVSWTGSGAYGADAGGPYGVDAGHDANADEGGDTDADTSSDSGDAGDQ